MKKIRMFAVIILVITLMTGCFKNDKMDDISIITTTYPIEYLVENMYGYNSSIDSMYPNGIDVKTYKLTNKQIQNIAKNNMIIYNGLTDERNIAAELLNYNKNLKAIDVTKGITIQRDEEELWLYPANYLMLAQNIKNGLTEYANSTITKQDIEDKYDDLKLTISKYDAELKVIADNATNKTIIAGNDVFKFLEKYGFKVLSIEDNDLFTSKEFNEAKSCATAKTCKKVFILNTDKEDTENTTKIKDLGLSIVKVNSMINRTDQEETDDYDYKQMMEGFIEQIKSEVYN